LPRRSGTVDLVSDDAASVHRDDDKLPIKMLYDRVMVELSATEGERLSAGGIVIPATAQMSKRLAWAEVVATGPNVRTMEVGDQVLFNPEDRYEVEVRGTDYIILRERDVHAVASPRLEESSTGLYL
jgi:chaperonin GroES